MPFVENYGLPGQDQIILPYEQFTSCFDSRTRNPRWVLERINKFTVGGPGDRRSRRSSFHTDKRIDALFRSTLDDYRGSGFDRGHMAPAGDHKTTQEVLNETFALTNISPQMGSFNRSYWRKFEAFIRSLVITDDGHGPEGAAVEGGEGGLSPPYKEVYVITGPLWLPSREESPGEEMGGGEGDVDISGEGSEDVPIPVPEVGKGMGVGKWVIKHDIIGSPLKMVAVPTHFFKVVIAEPYPPESPLTGPGSSSSPAAVPSLVAAFIMPNEAISSKTDLRSFLVPLDILEAVAGMRLVGPVAGLGENARKVLNNVAISERTNAGGEDRSSSSHALTPSSPGALVRTGVGNKSRLYMHLCSATSCQG
ncbi:unnamed protein product [Discosporangium mesarthrocarpum]